MRTISVGRRPTGIAFGEGAVWVANTGDDSVTRIDPATGATRTIGVGRGPTAVAVGSGAVWVANTADGTVSRIDPATNGSCETIEIGNAPYGVAVGEGFVWIAVQAPWRARYLRQTAVRSSVGSQHDTADALRHERRLVEEADRRGRRGVAGEPHVELAVRPVALATLQARRPSHQRHCTCPSRTARRCPRSENRGSKSR